MALFGMFKSRRMRDAELKAEVRRAKMRIQKFAARKQTQADSYRQLAREAWDLGDQSQFQALAADYVQCCDTVERWKAYLIKLKTLELRKEEGEATRDFLGSMNALTSSILNGVRPDQVMLLKADMEAAISHSEDLEDALAVAMDDAVVRTESPDAFDQEFLSAAVGVHVPASRAAESVSTDDNDFRLALESVARGVPGE